MNIKDANAILDNPDASPADLASIAYEIPSLRLRIVKHPKVYKGLLNWLVEFGDEKTKKLADAKLTEFDVQEISAQHQPVQPIQPPQVQQPQPAQSIQPVQTQPQPLQPLQQTVQPVQAVQPQLQPTQPAQVQPAQSQPTQPAQVQPAQSIQPVQPAQPQPIQQLPHLQPQVQPVQQPQTAQPQLQPLQPLQQPAQPLQPVHPQFIQQIPVQTQLQPIQQQPIQPAQPQPQPAQPMQTQQMYPQPLQSAQVQQPVQQIQQPQPMQQPVQQFMQPAQPQPEYAGVQSVVPGTEPIIIAPKRSQYTMVQALDPGLDLNVMADMAQNAPELREYIARNRSAYPELLHWLASLDDKLINYALESREDGQVYLLRAQNLRDEKVHGVKREKTSKKAKKRLDDEFSFENLKTESKNVFEEIDDDYENDLFADFRS